MAAPATGRHPPSPLYDTIGEGYTTHRRSDPRWAAVIEEHLGGAHRIGNVGAGTGSYEPPGAALVALEPSALMVAQRPPGSAPVVRASGTALPLGTGSLDAVMAILTLHHWNDWRRGLDELRRVAPRRVILTIDFGVLAQFWLLRDYVPSVADYVRTLEPTVQQIAATLPITAALALPLPPDLTDGVIGAHWRRPEAHLDPVVRSNTSPLALADPEKLAAGLARLEADLASGEWHERHGSLLDQDRCDLGYRLLVSEEA